VLSLNSPKRFYILLALVGVAVLLVLTRPDREPGLQEAIAPKVVVAVVGLHELLPVETVSGRLEPARRAALHFELSGQVFERAVEPGQVVEKDALLLSLSAGDYQDALAEAEAQFEIVVNDSLILVDFARRMRAEGMERIDAMVEAGRVRVRPILLTSITTFLGISPLIFFATGQTAFLSPMAVSLGFGLLFATVIILIAIPCFYLIADDLREHVRARLRTLYPAE